MPHRTVGRANKAIAAVLAGLLVFAVAFTAFPGQALAKNSGKAKGGPHALMQQIEELRTAITELLTFLDLDDAPWAKQYILKWQHRGIIKGRDKHHAAPNSALNRAEAVTMVVRYLDLEDEADEAGDDAIPFDDVDRQARWAHGYIAVALDHDLIDAEESSFHPQREASRVWATQLLVRALDYKLTDVDLAAEVEANMDADLEFKDANAIPSWAVGYVAVAVERGLINGYPNNTFRPGKALSRAEMAKLLDMVEDGLPDQLVTEIRGTVVSLDVYAKTWKLTVSSQGQTRVIPVADGVRVFVNGDEADLADLENGDRVEVELDTEGYAVLIKAKVEETEIEGTVTHVGLSSTGTPTSISIEDADGDEATYQVSADVTVELDGEEIDFDEIEIGDEAELEGIDGVVTSIKVDRE